MRWLPLALVLCACTSSADYAAQGQAALSQATAAASNAQAAMTSEAAPRIAMTQAAYWRGATATAEAIPTATATNTPEPTPTVTNTPVPPTLTPMPTPTETPTPAPRVAAQVTIIVPTVNVYVTVNAPEARATPEIQRRDEPMPLSQVFGILAIAGALIVGTLLLVWRFFLRPRSRIIP